MDDKEYNEYVVKKGTIRYKFIIVLFILSICIFHPEMLDFVKQCSNIENINTLLFIHGIVFVSIVYLMLIYSGGSFIMSPCNIELDYDDFIYYKNISNTINKDETIND